MFLSEVRCTGPFMAPERKSRALVTFLTAALEKSDVLVVGSRIKLVEMSDSKREEVEEMREGGCV